MQFIALQLSVQAEQVDIFIKKPHDCASGINSSNFEDKLQSNPSEDNQILSADESLAGLHASFSFQQGDLVSPPNQHNASQTSHQYSTPSPVFNSLQG